MEKGTAKSCDLAIEKGGTVYVKGNRVMNVSQLRSYGSYSSLFSYNVFNDSELNRDRDFVPEKVVDNVAENIFLRR